MNIYPRPSSNIDSSMENDIESQLLIQKYCNNFVRTCKKDIQFISILLPSFKRNSITFYFALCLILTFIGTLGYFFNPTNPLYIDATSLSYIGIRRFYISNKYEYYRLLTATFFHSNIWNLLINAYYLMNLGTDIETKYGPLAYSCFLLLSAVYGNVITCATSTYEDVQVGTSCILTGFAGMFLAELIIHHKDIRDKLTTWGNFLFTFLSLILTMSFLPYNGSFFGDLGGILVGLCFVCALEKNAPDTWIQKMKIILIVLTAVSFVAGFITIIAYKY